MWLILIYKPNEQDSKKVKDIWRELAEKYYGIFKVGAANCLNEQELCEDFMVFDYPSVRCYSSNTLLEPFKYEGEFQVNKLVDFAVGKMESFVKLVVNSNYEEFIKEE